MTAGLSMAGEMVGWLSDAKCAAAGKAASEGHAKCAAGCVKGGQPIAFVNDADKKVYTVSNQDKAMDFVGKKVTVDAKVTGDAIEITSVSE
jgi:hypothetical protein